MSDRDREVAPKTRGADDRGVLLGVAALFLILPASEPGSSLITNASGVRTIDIPPAPKKPKRRSRAQIAFMRAESELDAYYRMGVSLDQSSMLAKVKAAEAIADRYRAVARKDPEYAVASWVRIAEVYFHFAEEIRRAPHPDRTELEAMALGPERLARQALDRAKDHAESHRVRGVWKARLERLLRL